MHRLSVCSDHGHRKARDAYVEVRHRRAVDEAQPHTFAALKQAGPVGGGRRAVDQKGVGQSVEVGEVGRARSNPSPGAPAIKSEPQAIATRTAADIPQPALRDAAVDMHAIVWASLAGRRITHPNATDNHSNERRY